MLEAMSADYSRTAFGEERHPGKAAGAAKRGLKDVTALALKHARGVVGELQRLGMSQACSVCRCELSKNAALLVGLLRHAERAYYYAVLLRASWAVWRLRTGAVILCIIPFGGSGGRLSFGQASTQGGVTSMTRVRVESFTISLDGYGAGPDQDIDNPLGVGGAELHQWAIPTRTIQKTLFDAEGGTTGVDNDFAARGFSNVGAWILGRNMFGPIRGPWPDMSWKGWWGDNPPYHVPVFVLTHHARPPIEMEGGTTFHFVTSGVHEAVDQARKSADGKDVRIGGGPNTIQQYLRAGLIDEMHYAVAPVLLGRGERLFDGVNLRACGYECVQFVATEKATHVVLRRGGRNNA